MSGIVAIIPARSGSKGVPDKNIKMLAGRPLLAYSIMAGRKSESVHRVIVSTDSEEYAEIAREYGAETPFLRPSEISGDSSTDYEFVRHLLDWMTRREGKQPELLVHLRPTTPLREINLIETAIDKMKMNKDATALRSVQEMPESAYKMFEIDAGCLTPIGNPSSDLDAANLPRQAYRKTYKANGYVDVLRTSHVLDHHKLHGNRVIAHVTPPIIEIDTPNDFEYLEYRVGSNMRAVRKLFGPDGG